MLSINEIFVSINGEINCFPQGQFVTFVRFQGCNFRSEPCKWCDTPSALDTNGEPDWWSVPEIVEEVNKYGIERVVLTGGEPFNQVPNDLINLIRDLNHSNVRVVIETNGSLPINLYKFRFHASDPESFKELVIVADYKTPSSGKQNEMFEDNFYELRTFDYVKFVIANQTDYNFAVSTVARLKMNGCKAKILFSPCNVIEKYKHSSGFPEMVDYMVTIDKTPFDVVSSLKHDGLTKIIVNTQVHKFLNVP